MPAWICLFQFQPRMIVPAEHSSSRNCIPQAQNIHRVVNMSQRIYSVGTIAQTLIRFNQAQGILKESFHGDAARAEE
jgi:hypothetical protein